MVIELTSDSDLPKCLNTASKQAKLAKQLAQAHAGISARVARGPSPQGLFSRTMIVTLINKEEVVIQFRPEPLDIEPFKIARKALGHIVPDIQQLKDEDLESQGIWVYWMTRVPGQTWFTGLRNAGPNARITINKSLGRILSKGRLEDDSTEVVDNRIRNHLDLLISSADKQIVPFHETAKALRNELGRVKTLPLFVAHFDLNEVNVMIDDNREVTGIIDWELSTPLPFGMGFSRIHTLAGEFAEGEFHMPATFEEAERGFWQEVEDGLAPDTREQLRLNWPVVDIAVKLGTLLGTFELEGNEIGPCNPVVVKALPKLLTYRIPFLRGTEPPYSD